MEDIKEIAKSLIGKTKRDAYMICAMNGFVCHVAKENGEIFVKTCDVNFSRINIVVENLIVTDVKIG